WQYQVSTHRGSTRWAGCVLGAKVDNSLAQIFHCVQTRNWCTKVRHRTCQFAVELHQDNAEGNDDSAQCQRNVKAMPDGSFPSDGWSGSWQSCLTHDPVHQRWNETAHQGNQREKTRDNPHSWVCFPNGLDWFWFIAALFRLVLGFGDRVLGRTAGADDIAEGVGEGEHRGNDDHRGDKNGKWLCQTGFQCGCNEAFFGDKAQ